MDFFMDCSCTWSAVQWGDIQSGAQTERRGDAGPVWLLLGGETHRPTALRFPSMVKISLTHLTPFSTKPDAQ
jgi:hypothetical protein